nr:MAG TPA: zinc knuckle protein [Bacteriophage sp.]
MIQDNEVGKYRKKADSNTSKAKKESKHKHIYKTCILIGKVRNRFEYTSIASYCSICGKIGYKTDPNRSVTEKLANGRYRMLTKEEILERNSDLEVFDISDMFAKYVPLNKEEK